MIKTVLLLISIVMAIFIPVLVVKNKNNYKSVFYIPKEYRLFKKCFIIIVWVISIGGIILFLWANDVSQSDRTAWGTTMYGQPEN